MAANLARAGMKVLLLEAGGDSEGFTYQVPCFHGLASEDPDYSWNFFVRHYGDDQRQAQDTKFRADKGGVLYPRAGTLGGCTAHNAMITVYPHDEDWDGIAALTGDQSWRADRMRAYFERLEQCHYRRRPWCYPHNRVLAAIVRRVPVLSALFGNRARHGFDGWLSTTTADPRLVLPDSELVEVILSAARQELSSTLHRALDRIEDIAVGDPNAAVDPNDWHYRATRREGLWFIPLATRKGRRNGTREYVKETQARLPENLVVRTGCLVTRVLFDGDKRAVGVEYLQAPHAYAADPAHDPDAGQVPVRTATASREVVLSGGAFNTPQLLKLSGVGPHEELARFGIDTVVDLPGVGEGLQDRYEVGVVTELSKDFTSLQGATFAPPLAGVDPDRYFVEWQQGQGLYCTNGAVLGIIKKSNAERPTPDLFVFGLPATFKGYYPGYSTELEHHRNCFTWAVLKAHTENTGGRVTLRSANPCDVPDVNFHYFDEGTDAEGRDLDAVVEGVSFARRLMAHAGQAVTRELVPGPEVKTREQIAEFVKREAWGHHASCTCRMGPDDDAMAVVDSRFRVRGTKGLRIVDASVFPRIPGFFIVAAVYMISEKATDAILADVPRPKRMTGRVTTIVKHLKASRQAAGKAGSQ
ncbi:MAG: choline dehydrogenase [Acidimicrobiaceae bacterium]|nr:choline dehydrogenase [Acidimicrobiaceae bacterium]